MIPQNVLSQKEILNILTEYVKLKPADLAWEDFYEGGAGQTFLELLAGVASFINTSHVLNRTENYIHYANLRSSIIAASEHMGYSVYRGSQPHIKMTIMSDKTFAKTRFDVIGTYASRSIILKDSTVFNQGEATQVEIIIGDLSEESLILDSERPRMFRFLSDNITEDMDLILNGKIVPYSKHVAKVMDGNWWTISNAFGGIDAAYINQADTPDSNYKAGDKLTVRYVARTEEIAYDPQAVKLDFGTLSASSVVDPYIPSENRDSIPINSSTYNETQNIVRGREDYSKNLRLTIPGCVSANGRDISPALYEVTYVMWNDSILPAAKKQEYLSKLPAKINWGVMPPVLSDPIRINCPLTIEVTRLNKNTVVDMVSLQNDINSILTKFHQQLGIFIDLEKMESMIEELDYVRIARITMPAGYSSQLKWNEYYKFTPNIDLKTPKS